MVRKALLKTPPSKPQPVETPIRMSLAPAAASKYASEVSSSRRYRHNEIEDEEDLSISNDDVQGSNVDQPAPGGGG